MNVGQAKPSEADEARAVIAEMQTLVAGLTASAEKMAASSVIMTDQVAAAVRAVKTLSKRLDDAVAALKSEL